MFTYDILDTVQMLAKGIWMLAVTVLECLLCLIVFTIRNIVPVAIGLFCFTVFIYMLNILVLL